jgi:RimJ/RimL family protein N-acetyltransferase
MEADFYADFRKWHPKPYFSFPEIPPASSLTFEKLTLENFEQLYQLFENDSSPFVDKRFKTYEGAKEYAQYLSVCGAYSPKHGGQDWLFKLPNQEYAGIVHLYDLSLETFAQNHKRAWIGFATKEEFRNQHITSKAVRHFIAYIFKYYPQIDFIHAMTLKENTASINFLLHCGFINDPAERLSKAHRFFILTRPTLS